MKMSYLSEFFSAFKDRFVEEVKIGDIGEEINKAIKSQEVFAIHSGKLNISISDAIIAMWIVMIIIFVLAWFLGRNPKRIPTGRKQLVAESLVSLLLKVCQSSNMSYEQAEKVIPYVGTIAVFISLTNVSVIFNIPPPAKNPAFPIALALFTIVYVIGMSISFVGLKGFWRSLVYPKAMLLPFKILDYLIKPMSLSLRLFGNIFGAFILMEFIYLIVPVILPSVIGLWFDIADGILQGVIFTYLTVNYIGEVIEGAHAANAVTPTKHSIAHN